MLRHRLSRLGLREFFTWSGFDGLWILQKIDSRQLLGALRADFPVQTLDRLPGWRVVADGSLSVHFGVVVSDSFELLHSFWSSLRLVARSSMLVADLLTSSLLLKHIASDLDPIGGTFLFVHCLLLMGSWLRVRWLEAFVRSDWLQMEQLPLGIHVRSEVL